MAVNCCCWPSAIEGLVGVTAMDTRLCAVTVKSADPLIEPEVA